nr:3-oxoacyl-[acyl-carrier-protein] synthase III C-terminal domain-containing protein [Octadecabacter dasysiphoniae]
MPNTVWTTQKLRDTFGDDAAKQAETTGVLSRRYCSSESQIDMACDAARAAIGAADIGVNDIDLVLSASAVPYQTLPSTAPLVMSRLGMADGVAAAFDVNSTCLSFLTALEVATRMICAQQARTALIVSSEIASRALPWRTDPCTAALFGDGAGAVIVRKSVDDSVGLKAAQMRTYPSAYDACSIGAGGTRIDYHTNPEEFARQAWFAMDGKELFRLSSRHFKGFVADLLDKAGWSLDDVDVIVPHQASPAGLTHMIKQVGVAPQKVVNIVAEYGNQIAASLPVALDHAMQGGRIQQGAKILFLGTSAGVSFGGVAWQT